MLAQDFEQSVGYWLLTTAHWMERALNASLEEHGITYRQVQVLSCLALRGQLTQAEIAEMLGVEPPTVVRVLDRMERDGWIVRDDDPQDRRKKLICPTERVAPVWEQFLACGKGVRQRATTGLSPDEVNRLIDSLKCVRSNLGVESETRSASTASAGGRT